MSGITVSTTTILTTNYWIEFTNPAYNPFKKLKPKVTQLSTTGQANEAIERKAASAPTRFDLLKVAVCGLWASFIHTLNFVLKVCTFVVGSAVVLLKKDLADKFPTSETVCTHFKNIFKMPSAAVVCATVGMVDLQKALNLLSDLNVFPKEAVDNAGKAKEGNAAAPGTSLSSIPTSNPELGNVPPVVPKTVTSNNGVTDGGAKPSSPVPLQASRPTAPDLPPKASKSNNPITLPKSSPASSGTQVNEQQTIDCTALIKDKLVELRPSKDGQRLIAVEADCKADTEEDSSWKPSELDLKLVLFTMLRDVENGLYSISFMRHVLKHESNHGSITEKEFFKYLLETDEEKQIPRLCTLSSTTVFQILKSIKKGLSIIKIEDLKAIRMADGNTFFSSLPLFNFAPLTECMFSMRLEEDCPQDYLDRMFISALFTYTISKMQIKLLRAAVAEAKIKISPIVAFIDAIEKGEITDPKLAGDKFSKEEKSKAFKLVKEFGTRDRISEYKELLKIDEISTS